MTDLLTLPHQSIPTSSQSSLGLLIRHSLLYPHHDKVPSALCPHMLGCPGSGVTASDLTHTFGCPRSRCSWVFSSSCCGTSAIIQYRKNVLVTSSQQLSTLSSQPFFFSSLWPLSAFHSPNRPPIFSGYWSTRSSWHISPFSLSWASHPLVSWSLDLNDDKEWKIFT